MSLGKRLDQCINALDLNQRKFADLCGWEKPARISHYINNRTTPGLEEIEIMANVLKCSPVWLAFGEIISEPPSYLGMNAIPLGKVPVISWSTVKEWNQSYDINKLLSLHSFQAAGKSSAGQSLLNIEFISVHKKNEKMFALKLKNDSMTSPTAGQRSFLENEIIFVDPLEEYKVNDYVIALQEGSNEAIFKQYIKNGNQKLLRSLGNYPPIPFDETITICGVVIAHLDVLL